MDTSKNDNNSSENAMGAQTGSVESNSGKVRDAIQQFQASFSSFVQEDQRHKEGIIALIKQQSEQLRTTDSKAQKNRTQIDKHEGWIRNNRS